MRIESYNRIVRGACGPQSSIGLYQTDRVKDLGRRDINANVPTRGGRTDVSQPVQVA